ncbi:hypothetical protein GY45DRAFT_1372945 [Cubamyces sp. BRFM 1775]|nr:hypothetical protein GY45DRAFT_1372945 [Cubamyces sp. BRFM 1775]
MAGSEALEDLLAEFTPAVQHHTDTYLKKATNISDLPAELLLSIFKILKQDERPDAQPFQAPWITVTWVCKRWRAIALAHPSLWSTLSLLRPPKERASLTAFLKRSANVALTLSIQPSSFFLLTTERTRRIRNITISYTPQQHQHIPKFIRRAGSTWTSLELHQQDASMLFGLHLDVTHVPNLRRLCITNIPLRPIGTLQGLTQLTIERPTEYSGRVLYGILQACPNLVELILKQALPYRELSTPHPDVLTVPKLERLTVQTYGQDVACFLARVRFPPSAAFSITLDYHGYPPQGDEYDGWLQGLLHPRQEQPSLPILTHTRSLALFLGCADIEADLRLFGSTAPERIALMSSSECWNLTVHNLDRFDDDGVFITPMLPYCCPHTVTDLLTLIVPTNITTLDLHIAPGLSRAVERDWPTWLARLPHLRELTIGGMPLIATILSSLHPRPDLLPELETLRLCFAILPEHPNGPDTDTEAFMVWLTLRLLAGMRLRTFAMQIPPGFQGQVVTPEPATVVLVRELASRAVGVDQPVQICYRLCETCHFVFDDVASLR